MSDPMTRAGGSAVDDAPPMPPHTHRRLRREVVLRTLEVQRVERLTPHMQRIILGGDGLHGFHSDAPDDHVKLFFPNRLGKLVLPATGPEGLVFPPGREPSPMRDYTPRRYLPERNELYIDFVLHGDGPAARWAEQAAPGQRVGLGGPRGSFVVADDFERYVLVGDETALPAIGRWLEEMPAGAQATAWIEVADARDRQPLPSRARASIAWLERDPAAVAGHGALERMLRNLPDQRDAFYWIAAESARVRAMRQWLDQQGVPRDWIRATGYWKAEPSDAPA